jgi:hypothetical protein
MSEPAYVGRLRQVVDSSEPLLRKLPASGAGPRAATGKWSPGEILGHLIDSASHNHDRFVRAVWQEDLVFPGYAQDVWVDVQRYHEAPWRELVDLWAAFNRQLARVMAGIPAEVRERPRAVHNLDEIAWRHFPRTSPATLDYFMADYVAHLEHHLAQLLGPDWEREGASVAGGAMAPYTDG